MTSVFAVTGAATLSYAGMACLALASERQQRHIRPAASRRGISRRAVWRVAGVVMLALSLLISLVAWGAGPGTAGWLGMISAVLMPLILAIAYVPTQVRSSAGVAATAGLICVLATFLGNR